MGVRGFSHNEQGNREERGEGSNGGKQGRGGGVHAFHELWQMICCWPPGQPSVGGAATVAKSVFGQQQQQQQEQYGHNMPHATCCMEMRCVEKQADGNLNFSSYPSSCSFPSSHVLLLLLFLSCLQTHTQGQGNSNCRYTRTEAHC